MICNLPRYATADATSAERDLTTWAAHTPILLILPCHHRDLTSPAFTHILQTLHLTPWIAEIAIGIDGATPSYPAVRAIHTHLPRATLHTHPTATGKGSNITRTLRATAPTTRAHFIALHDCDVLTYDREFLARLCWPVLHPTSGLLFCKGSYHRVTHRLHGRLTRLLFQPLVTALLHSPALPAADHHWLTYLASWHYPLSGECCAPRTFWDRCTLATGWEAEVNILRSAYQQFPLTTHCQAELCASFDHHHQPLSPTDPAAGLHRSATEVATALLRTLTLIPSTLPADYATQLATALHHSQLRATANGLSHDPAEEQLTALVFQNVISQLHSHAL